MSDAMENKILALLKDMNQVLEIGLNGNSRCDGNRPEPHPHLISTQCNAIVDGDVEIGAYEIGNLEEESGYMIRRSQVSFYGRCSNCNLNFS